jgi:hypothetical protein
MQGKKLRVNLSGLSPKQATEAKVEAMLSPEAQGLILIESEEYKCYEPGHETHWIEFYLSEASAGLTKPPTEQQRPK